ncbi:MAG TPA: glycosyltransferase family 2 protein [Longimicrobium sp.]|nr:glycosyltransferase family 2 protein [Longimicrobium sp.]
MIYICIPALNEARTIGVLLWKIRQVMDEFPRDYHVLVLDDGSTDDTREVLEPYLRVLPVTVLRNERTLGYAAGLERLIREAANRSTHPKRDVVVTLQADFTESPDDIPLLLKKLEGGADVVGVTVTGTEGELPRAIRWSRRGLPWLLSRTRVPKELGDPLTGFRAYRVAVLRRALQDHEGRPLLTKHGWAANAELLLCVLPHVRRAEGAEVSLRYTRRERATRFRPWSTALELWDLARKAPRRLAQARAASEAADARAAAPPAPPAGDPAFRQRVDQIRTGLRPSGPAERPAAAPAAQQRPPRPERPTAAPAAPRPPRHAERPVTAVPAPEATASSVDSSPEAAQEVEMALAEQEQPARPTRRRPPRRRSAAARAAASGEASATPGDTSAESVPAPAAAPAESTTAPEAAPTAEAGGDGGDTPSAPKRSRPRRPRRPRSPRPPAGEGEGQGGEE